jgi:hypothetical protein
VHTTLVIVSALQRPPASTHRRRDGIPHNGVMLMGNKRAQRITVGVIIGVIVVSLALSLISTASATP